MFLILPGGGILARRVGTTNGTSPATYFIQPAQQLLALSKSGGGGMPDGWQVVREMADLLALRGRERESRLFGSQSIFPFQFFAFGQFLIPFAFQTTGHQTIVWVDSLVPSPCQVRLMTSARSI